MKKVLNEIPLLRKELRKRVVSFLKHSFYWYVKFRSYLKINPHYKSGRNLNPVEASTLNIKAIFYIIYNSHNIKSSYQF